jgi:zinc-ribbon domain
MSDFFESAKTFVNSAVSRTGWEAQKQLRQRGKQSEIDKLLEQRQQLMEELGQVAMNLYQQGALTDTQLSRLCASIFELDHDLRTRESQLQEIKNEVYSAAQVAPNPVMNYAPPNTASSTNPQQPYTAGNNNAGAPNPNASAGPQSGIRCPQCSSPLRPGAIYCRNCGAKLQ